MAPKKTTTAAAQKAEAKKDSKAQAEAAKKEEPKKEEPAKEEVKAETKEEKVEAKEEAPVPKVEAKEEAAAPKAEDVDMKTENEEPTELEENAPVEKRAKVKPGQVGISLSDATMNVMSVANGKMLMSLTDGGLQFLLASARGNTGLKAGRYMFEARIVESLNPIEMPGSRSSLPRQLLRIGVSLANSSVILGDGKDNICFDSDGFITHDKSKKKVAEKFSRDMTVALLLNLDEKSANANTISLFRNGVRISDPQKLPDNLRGKTLFPTITYKNVTVHVNFGPSPKFALPFTCNMLGDAAAADVEALPVPAPPKDGKFEVLLPVGLPDNGYFEWVDNFLAKNPTYTELSDRKLIEWASKSGLTRSKASGSNDKPSMNFQVPQLEDLSVQRVLDAIAPTLKRNFIVPELRANLLAEERKETLQKFLAADFKRKAAVVMGEPNQEYKEKVYAVLLADKIAMAELDKKKKAQDKVRNKLIAERKKKVEESKKAREAQEANKKKKAAEVAKKAEDGAEGEATEEAQEPAAAADEDMKEDETKAEETAPAQEEETKKEEEEEAEEPDVPVVLTDEDKKQWHRKLSMADLSDLALAKAFADFSLPSKAEGFDDVTFDWQKEAACSSMLKAYVLDKKKTQRCETLEPGAHFKEEWSKWQKQIQEWKQRQGQFKDPSKRKAMLAKKKEDADKLRDEAKQAASELGDEAAAKAEETEAPMEIDMDTLDVFAVEDVMDVGSGEPLFANFAAEDWALLSTRFELHLLLHAFKKDLNDADRPSFGEDHLAFYFGKYFKRQFSIKYFGADTIADFVELLKDTLSIDSTTNHLVPELSVDTPFVQFVKLTEENRRERQRRIDAGDETAKLKITRPAASAPPARQHMQQQGTGGNAVMRSGTQRTYAGAGGGKSSGKGSGQGYAPPPPATRPSYGGYGQQPGGYAGGGLKRPYSGVAPAAQSSYGAGSPKHQRTTYGAPQYGGSSQGQPPYYPRR